MCNNVNIYNNGQVEVLLSVINKESDKEILDHLKDHNITTNAIVVNQSDFSSVCVLNQLGNDVKIYSLEEQGVGLSRNTALQRATKEFVLFADDDEYFHDGYEAMIIDAFSKVKNADIILFNVKSLNKERPSAYSNKISRVYWFNAMRYGTYQIAVRLSSVRKNRLSFSTFFGGGALFGSGEDSLFIIDALSRGCKVYAFPVEIGVVKQEKSTWFNGYDEKYYHDRGALYAAAFNFPKVLGLIQIIRKNRVFQSNISMWRQYLMFCRGIYFYRKMR